MVIAATAAAIAPADLVLEPSADTGCSLSSPSLPERGSA